MTGENSNNEQRNNSPSLSRVVVDKTDYFSFERDNDDGEVLNSSTHTVEKEMPRDRCESTVMSFICQLKVNP